MTSDIDISPLGELIIRSMRAKGLSREKVVRLVGYYNLPKGLQMLDDLIIGKALAYKHTPMLNLPKVLGVSRKEFDAAMDRTLLCRVEAAEDQAAKIGYYNERTFRPHIWIVTPRKVPTQICILALVGGEGVVKHVALPEGLVHADGRFDAEAIGAIILDHYQKKEGRIQFFGDIIAYRLVRKYGDNGIEFSPEGVILTDTPPPLLKGESVLMVGNKTVPKEIWDK